MAPLRISKASRKVLEVYLALATNDRGLTWTDVTREGISGMA